MKCKFTKGCRTRAVAGSPWCPRHRAMQHEYSTRWCKKNRKHILAYRQAHKPETAAYAKRYAQVPANRARIRKWNAASKRRRFFRNRAYFFNTRYGSALTAKQLARLWHRQRGRCALTGWKLTRETAHLDHRIPKSKGGKASIRNLRWVHEVANHAKWDMLDADLLTFCRAVIDYGQI